MAIIPESGTKQTTPMEPTHRHRFFPHITVTLIGDAEMRIAEMKRSVVIYQRGDQRFVRTREEFDSLFKPMKK